MKKILVIEDDENIRESLVELLEMKSYEIYSADNGSTGLQLALEKKPDLILCDVMMPGLSGYEVVESVRKDPFLARTPFIFLSAKAMESDIQKGLQLGANNYLTKPFRAGELFGLVDKHLNNGGNGGSGVGKAIDGLLNMVADWEAWLNRGIVPV